jgi:TPR repeat protein
MWIDMKVFPAGLILASLMLCSAPSFASFEYDESTAASEDFANWMAQAEKGDAEAEYNVAECYLKGEGGVKQDERKAAEWYEKAANQGYVDAERAMGFVYRGGGGKAMNKVLSYMWFDLASKNGDEGAAELRNDVAWSMTQTEIDEARKREREWKPVKEKPGSDDN